MSDRDTYEIEPRVTVGRGYNAAQMRDGGFTETTARERAAAWLAEHPEHDEIGIYHTHPSPGPVRRFVAAVRRV